MQYEYNTTKYMYYKSSLANYVLALSVQSKLVQL